MGETHPVGTAFVNMIIAGDDSDRADIDDGDGDVSGGVIEACWSIGGNWGVMSHTGDSCIDEHNTW